MPWFSGCANCLRAACGPPHWHPRVGRRFSGAGTLDLSTDWCALRHAISRRGRRSSWIMACTMTAVDTSPLDHSARVRTICTFASFHYATTSVLEHSLPPPHRHIQFVCMASCTSVVGFQRLSHFALRDVLAVMTSLRCIGGNKLVVQKMSPSRK